MEHDEYYAILEIAVEMVKNDMICSGTIESTICFAPTSTFSSWVGDALVEMEAAQE